MNNIQQRALASMERDGIFCPSATIGQRPDKRAEATRDWRQAPAQLKARNVASTIHNNVDDANHRACERAQRRAIIIIMNPIHNLRSWFS